MILAMMSVFPIPGNCGVIRGGVDIDTIVGGRGDDILIGGDGGDADRFVFNKGDGNDTIIDLLNGRIDLSALHEFRDYDDLRRHIYVDNAKHVAVIDLVGDNSITLEQYLPSNIQKYHFIL